MTRILIVDDERPIRRFLKTSLGAQGYEVLEAATGKDAISEVIQNKPDLLIPTA